MILKKKKKKKKKEESNALVDYLNYYISQTRIIPSVVFTSKVHSKLTFSLG